MESISPLNSFKPPPLTEQLIALTLALVGGLGFVRDAISPEQALLPYPPELLQPAQEANSNSSAVPHHELFRGNLSMGDKYNQSLAWDRITQDRLKAGEIPLWTRDIASGVPFVPQMGQVYHPLNLLLLAVPSVGVYGIWYLLHMALMGFFAYRFMRRIQISHQAALLGMVCVIAGFWLQARVHHNVMLSAALPVFAMLSCTHHILVHRGGGGHIAMLALATGLSWISGFAPASLLCTYLTCSYALVLFFSNSQSRDLFALLRFAAAIALGLLLATAHLGPVVLAAMETSRGPATPEILAARSLEWNHLATAVWPTVFSWPGDHFYPDGRIHNTWASLAFLDKELYQAAFNYPETAFYIGLIPLCLMFSGLRVRSGWLFAAAGLFGLAMALGLCLPWSKYLPGAHSGDLKRFLLLFALCMPVVAAMGLDRILQSATRRLPLALLAIVGVLSLELALLHLYPAASLQNVYGSLAEQRLGQPSGTFQAWLDGYPGEGDANRWHLLQSFMTASVVCALGCLALVKLSRFTATILILVTLAELLYLGQGSIVTVANARVTAPPAILGPVLDATQANGVRPRLQRLMPPTDPDPLNTPAIPNMAGFWGVEDLAGYSPLPNARMEEFFLALEPNDPAGQKVDVVLGGAGVRSLRDPNSLTHPLSDLIGIEWILTPLQLDLPNLTDRTPAELSRAYRLYQRSGSLPRATFVRQVEVLEDPAKRLRTLADRSRNLRDTVILETAQAPIPSPGATTGAAQVTIRKHADEVVVIDVDTPADGYLRLADPYDAGWTAEVDGTATPVYPADHYFRAVYLEAGKHQLVFRYNGLEVKAPQWISLGAILGLFLTLWLSRRNRKTLAR